MMENNNPDSELEEINFTPEERKLWEKAEQEANEHLRKAQTGGGEAEKDSQVVFECRLCGSGEFITHTANNGVKGPGGRSWTVGYECSGCSVTFSDLAKFSARM